MSKIVPAAAAALTFLIVPQVASAEPGNGNGRGLAILRELQEEGVFCPPGLAGRDPACVPPGQARRMLTEDERAERREERRAERRAEAEREAERIREARAERRAERIEAEERAAARAEAEREAEARALARAEEDTDDDAGRAAQILTALLTLQQVAAAPSTAPQVLPLQGSTSSVPAPAAQQPMDLTEALARAAASGAIGY